MKMKEFWEFRAHHHLLVALLICCLYMLNLRFCCSLNDEGTTLLKFKEEIVSDPFGALSDWNDEVGVESPCSWFGVGCSGGFVVVLNLKDLCLRGTLAPEIKNLVHLKSIVLRNNSFYGVIPDEIAGLNELEVLDLGYNNFSGQIPCSLAHNFSMAILLLDNNEHLSITDPETYELQKLSEVQVEEDLLSIANRAFFCNALEFTGDSGVRRRELLQEAPVRRTAWSFSPPPPGPPGEEFPLPLPLPPPPPPLVPSPPVPSPSLSPSPSLEPSPEPLAPSSSTSPVMSISPPSRPSPAERPSAPMNNSGANHRQTLIISAAIAGPLLLLILAIGIYIWKSGKVATVKPWATGLSGQLQRAFVTGVPKLKRSELEAACEDFSNVIGTLSVCTLYKGTLSSGVEIAVASIVVASSKDWSKSRETQFRKKIETLSKVNHKNFLSLIGYCVEEKPFTRMMVFEYAPNGNLFEHLHIREAEHLDWTMRLRVIMGMAYCLDHMHQLSPALLHSNLTSSSVYLTEDYAAKVSDFVLWDKGAAAEMEPSPESNVYSFGVVLFEMMTGKLPYTSGADSVEDWASDYLKGGGRQRLRQMVDPTLKTYGEDQLQQIEVVIKSCTNPNPRQRPSMTEVCTRLREVTGIGPDGAVPKVSPLWWAELEILSEAS